MEVRQETVTNKDRARWQNVLTGLDPLKAVTPDPDLAAASAKQPSSSHGLDSFHSRRRGITQ
jgi:hypothetical protein